MLKCAAAAAICWLTSHASHAFWPSEYKLLAYHKFPALIAVIAPIAGHEL